MTAAEYFGATVGELSALWEAYEQRRTVEDIRWARLTYLTYLSVPFKDHPRTLTDFMLFPPPPPPPPTADELFAQWQAAFPAHLAPKA